MSSAQSRNNLKLRRFERNICPKGYKVIAGVDEAGRGPLAGPVVAAAVVLKKYSFKSKIFDSKRLSALSRRRAFAELINNAYIGVGIVDRETIDRGNILQATILAMNKAIGALKIKPDYLLIDGCFKKGSFPGPYKTVKSGDMRSLSIASASIIAKELRDSLLSFHAQIYPEYGFERHRGYGTSKHIAALKKHGLSPIHRRSFRPVSEMK